MNAAVKTAPARKTHVTTAMAVRKSFMWVHRWSGLVIAAFLIIVGLTGTVLAFHDEIDRALNPELRIVQPSGQRLAPERLMEIAQRAFPHGAINSLPLHREANESTSVWMVPRPDPLTGKPYDLGFDEVILNPYTGDIIATRRSEDIGVGRDTILETVFRLHYSMLAGKGGEFFLGGVALVWLLNCLIGFYLTMPEKRRRFFPNWKRSWLVRSIANIWRFSFDFHRAAGLWLWAVLLMFALSAVQFNLFDAVFRPMVSLVMPIVDPVDDIVPHERPVTNPRLGWPEALARGRQLMGEAAARDGFKISYETFLYLNRPRDAFVYSVHSNLDVREKGGDTEVAFSATDGKLIGLSHPRVSSGNALVYWLGALHMAKLWGVPYQVFVSLMGLLIAGLSITGVLVWFKRRGS